MKEIQENIGRSIEGFRLPKYSEIPDVGLFLEQTTKYICQCLAPLGVTITGSMISNYVKMKLIASPVKKQYSREQIAYLLFIAVGKSVLSLENIQILFQLQKRTYSTQRAYEYFCEEFENVLFLVFGLKQESDVVGEDISQLKQMLRNTIITVCHKIYLEKCFREIGRFEEGNTTGEPSLIYI